MLHAHVLIWGPVLVQAEFVPHPPFAVKQLLIGAQSVWLFEGEK